MFKKADLVFGTAGPSFGANAEYIFIPEDNVITLKPTNVNSYEAAASIDGFLTALPFLRDPGEIKSSYLWCIRQYWICRSTGCQILQCRSYQGV